MPGISIFHSSATIYFANAEMYQDALGRKVKTHTHTKSLFERLISTGDYDEALIFLERLQWLFPCTG